MSSGAGAPGWVLNAAIRVMIEPKIPTAADLKEALDKLEAHPSSVGTLKKALKSEFSLRDLESRASRLYVAFRMRREVEIVNKLGLHARPASEFVRCVIRFKSTITICKGEESFSAASILEVLSADLDCGARVVLEAIGPDEQEALKRLEALLLRFRDEEGGSI